MSQWLGSLQIHDFNQTAARLQAKAAATPTSTETDQSVEAKLEDQTANVPSQIATAEHDIDVTTKSPDAIDPIDTTDKTYTAELANTVDHGDRTDIDTSETNDKVDNIAQ